MSQTPQTTDLAKLAIQSADACFQDMLKLGRISKENASKYRSIKAQIESAK